MIIYPVRPGRMFLVALVICGICGWLIRQSWHDHMYSLAVVFGVLLLFAALTAFASLRHIDRKMKVYFE